MPRPRLALTTPEPPRFPKALLRVAGPKRGNHIQRCPGSAAPWPRCLYLRSHRPLQLGFPC